ncbi:fungal-specific transcription factor domain-containing protein [Aspergillus californicus]
MDSVDGIEKPAPLACTECRRKHLRCDAAMPTCMRCTSSGARCQYFPSRRGLKRRAPHVDQPPRTPRSPPRSTDGPVSVSGRIDRADPTNGESSISGNGGPDEAESRSHTGPSPVYGGREAFTHTPGVTPVSPERAQPSQYLSVEDDEVLISLYYANFHAAHPFLVPRSLYASQAYPAYLKLVVHFVGSHFSDTTSSHLLCSKAADLLSKVEATSSAVLNFHLVQAKLLFSIVLHARNNIQHSTAVLVQAVALALEIGMHRKSFQAGYGKQSPLEEESLRRTWWELYVTDGVMAALQRRPSSRCHDSQPDVPLPCDDVLYAQCVPSIEPLSLAQFDSRIFTDEEISFSSFTYRIEAVRLLSRVVSIAWTHDVHADDVDALDSALAAWPYHLDAAKTSMAHGAGTAEDEMLFQANLLVQFGIMYLHFPRSDLVATVPGATRVIRQQHVPPVSTRNTHGQRALVASKQLSKLAAMQVPVQKHTPFFVCAIVFAALVQLSACSLHQVYGPPDRYRDHVSLTIGILKALGPMWELAQVTLRSIKYMAAEILSLDSSPMHPISVGDNNVQFFTPLQDLPILDLPWLDLFSSACENWTSS